MSCLMLNKEVLKMQLKKAKTISRMSLIKEKSLTLLMRLEVAETIGAFQIRERRMRIQNMEKTKNKEYLMKVHPSSLIPGHLLKVVGDNIRRQLMKKMKM